MNNHPSNNPDKTWQVVLLTFAAAVGSGYLNQHLHQRFAPSSAAQDSRAQAAQEQVSPSPIAPSPAPKAASEQSAGQSAPNKSQAIAGSEIVKK